MKTGDVLALDGENVVIKKAGNISRITYVACKSDKYLSKSSRLFIAELLNTAKKY